jgi:PAS domain-containing protein
MRAGIHIDARQVLAVTLSALLVMLLGIITTLFDGARMQHAFDKAVHRNDVRFQTLAEAIPQIVWIADTNGGTTYLNN